MQQDKQKEVAFFDNLASSQEYNVFTDEANNKIIHTLETLLALEPGARLLDLGCGSGIFTQLLQARGYHCVGLDLSQKLLGLGKQQTPAIDYVQADVEALPFASESVDYVILSCLVHHLPNPKRCAEEVFRVLKPNGKYVAFDPNRLNPFMYLYRDRSSPFYSSKGVTENERPVLPKQVQSVFTQAGLEAASHFVDGLAFRYVASGAARGILPIYNFFDRTFFRAQWLSLFRAFVFTYGIKPAVI
ncbi:methyltransferase domain-containing protein [Candidatus Berkiella aquae]|uniref:Class I SAM-dependent methyltransferase n=1 Tax=Candidatus Berkiella aquae TaxID=295108 RepID=A0A0Q9YNV6_9GAMM|nr:class I SAM-dependent methyltransferase [Candidatus Berkiella aquae]MCS5712140.1 class I SAM-dependent methyltransferase [Candidatus Berkiella aquae]